MKKNEDTILKELITLEIRKTPNKDFTIDTIATIKLSKQTSPAFSYSLQTPFLLALVMFALLFIGFSIIQFLSVIVSPNPEDFLIQVGGIVSSILLSPTSIAIMLSFCILHYADLYLQKQKFAKPTPG